MEYMHDVQNAVEAPEYVLYRQHFRLCCIYISFTDRKGTQQYRSIALAALMHLSSVLSPRISFSYDFAFRAKGDGVRVANCRHAHATNPARFLNDYANEHAPYCDADTVSASM